MQTTNGTITGWSPNRSTSPLQNGADSAKVSCDAASAIADMLGAAAVIRLLATWNGRHGVCLLLMVVGTVCRRAAKPIGGKRQQACNAALGEDDTFDAAMPFAHPSQPRHADAQA